MCNNFWKKVFLLLIAIIGTVALCPITNGAVVLLVVIATSLCAISKKYGLAIIGFMIVVLFQVLSTAIVGEGGYHMLVAKGGVFLLSILFSLLMLRPIGARTFSFSLLFVYLIYMTLPSSVGWFPMVSFLKLLLFASFLWALYRSSAAMQTTPEDMLWVRAGIMAVSIFCIWGSVYARLVPSIGYSMQVRKLAQWSINATGAELASGNGHLTGISLFNGIFFHSQALAPIMAAVMLWVVCDMLFVEKRLSFFHGIILLPSPYLLYLTRSRTGMLAFTGGLLVVWLYAIPRANVPTGVRRSISMIMSLMVIALGSYVGVQQLRHGTIQKLLNKTDEVQNVTIDSMMSTRLGKIDENLYEFKANPIIGKGFQTSPDHPHLYKTGDISWLSAPIEKSILPLMVLGEGGVIGAVLFLAAVLSFFSKCRKGKAVVTLVLFSVMFLINMGEATFFSPSGAGGLVWCFCFLGGAVIDLISSRDFNMIRESGYVR